MDRAPRITLVVAVARNGVIGEHNGLPWRLPSELKRFKQITMGHPCIMGRRTWDGVLASLGKPLPGRDSIVLTRGAPIAVDGVHTARTLNEALEAGRKLAQARGVADVMVIGGGEVYRQALPVADRIWYTRVEVDATGDTHFPALDPGQWRETAREPHDAGTGDTADYTILTLDRVGDSEMASSE